MVTSRGNAPLARLALLGCAFALALLSCGRDVTSPGSVARYAHGISWRADFPPAYQVAGDAASSVVDFNRVHVVLHHADGTVALDTVIAFPAGADSVAVTLDVRLLPTAPASGEPLSLNLAYINAAGDTVFKGGPVGVTATPSSPGSTPPPAVTIPVSYTGPGASAVGVRISPHTATVNSGGSFTFSAVAVDASGAPVAGAPIVWNSLDPSVASVPSAVSGLVLAGSARGTARIVAQLLTGPTDQATLSVLPRATAIAAQSGSGQSGFVGSPLANPLVAIVTASDGGGVGGVTVTFAVASGGGSVGSATAVTNDAGLAQTTWRLGNSVGTQAVTATAGALSGSPVTFTATAKSLAASKLAFATQPGNAAAGATLSTVTVVALTAAGDTASTFTGAVSLALSGGTTGAALGGTTTVNAVGGVATFANLTVNKSGTGYSLTASASGLTGAATGTFDITAGALTKLVFTAIPGSAPAGTNIAGPLTVAAEDAAGNVVTSFTGTVSLALANNPGGSTLTGTTSVSAVAGVATFSSLFVFKVGTGYTLAASASGLASATSYPFDISVGAAANLILLSGGSQTGNVSAALASPVVVQVTDVGGNGVAGRTVTFAAAAGSGSVSAASVVTDAGGLASVTWTLGATVGTQTMTATSSGLAGSPLSVSATGASVLNHFAVTTQPAATDTAGVNVFNGFVVSARDASNALIPTFTGTVTLALGANPGGATLGGTTSVSAVAGVATFNAFKLDKAGTGYTVVASATGYSSVTSSAFNVVAGTATTMAISAGNAQSGPVSALLATPLSVLVTDANGNPVAGRTITWAVATGGGSLDSATSVTNAAGIGSRKWTLGALAGTQSVTATATGLTGSPLTFTATAAGGVASTTVTPHLDSLTSIGATFQLAAQAKDGASNPVAGTYTWVSRTPAVATVSVAGLVTGVTNGSTWVVATEAGGTKDSAQVVVQQQLATINVSPGTSSIHLGAAGTFTAQAVDGLGHALSAQPVFAWSSTVPSVATVNSSGQVTTLLLGPTQIRATAGTVSGIANVNVITAITRIVVARDSAGFSTVASDTFNMAALGLHRAYRAYAYDTLSALMPTMTFTWGSSNASVALIDTSSSNRADVVSAANGSASIQATAQGVTGTVPQGVTGSALLNVQQVLSSIAITPVSPSIQPTGTVSLTARGKDSNGQFISGGTFTWTSRSTGIATVNSSGQVLGVAVGTDTVTATSGSITSTPDPVIVANSVPATLSFGHDTISVGRGSSTSVPILLSRPSASTTTLLLTVADTFAFWSSAKVVVPIGTTSINATLNGHNAGNTTITVTDSAGVYAPSTSVLAVQATMRLTSGGYALNATDQVRTQVVLSDPSPAGGTYVTFSYGTAGVASVSPSPALIPAGQLAADIVITAVAAGNTSITPVAIGVNGTASSFTSYAPNLTFSTTSIRLGLGQYEPNVYAYTPTATVNPLPLTFHSSDTTKVTVTPAVTIPGGSNYSYITNSAVGLGTATVTVSASGWTAANSLTVNTTTPHVGICCGNSGLFTTSPQFNVTVYSEDSTKTAHYRTSSLVVHLASTDTTVLKVLDTVVTIGAGIYYNGSARIVPGGTGGTASIIATAGGHTPDTASFAVAGPPLHFSWASGVVGKGQQDNNLYVYTPNNVVSPLTVNITVSDTSKVSVPTIVTIPTGTNYVYFSLIAKDTGHVTFNATATGYQAATPATYTVTTPRVGISGGGTFNNFSAPAGFTVYAEDSLRNAHYRTTPLVVSLRSTDTNVVKFDSASVTIPAGIYYNSSPHVIIVGVGTAQVVASAGGHTSDSVTYTVIQPTVYANTNFTQIGNHQYYPANSFYVYTPNSRSTIVPVTLTQRHPSVVSLSTTVDTIAAGTNYQYFTLSALTTGADTITISATGYTSTTMVVLVSTPRLTNSGLPGSTTTTNPPIGLNVYATDSSGSGHYVPANLTVHAVSSDTNVIRVANAYFPIVAGNYYANTSVTVIGPGTASITYTDSAGTGYLPTTTNTITVTGPSLNISNGTTMLGMRQTGGATGAYVYAPNNVATPLVVNLISTSTRVVSVPASVTIPAGSNYAYFQITALDTVGTIQVQASAIGYNAASTNVQVTQPQLVISTNTSARTTQGRQGMTIYATDANGTAHYTTDSVRVSLASSALTVATVDSASVLIPIGSYYVNTPTWSPGIVGTSQLQASDTSDFNAFYRYKPGVSNLSVYTPTLGFDWGSTTLGIGQYIDNQYVYTPDNVTSNTTVNFTHTGTARANTLVGGSPVSSVTIPSGSNYTYFRLQGVATGTDTLVATLTSPNHNPVTAYTVVGPGRVDTPSGWPSAISIAGGDSVLVTLYARDPSGNARYVAAATTFNLSSTAPMTFASGGATITTATIPAGAYYVQFYLKGVSAGTANVSISATNYTTWNTTVTISP